LSALPVKWRNFFQLPSHFPENINIPIIGESLHRLSLAFYFSIPRNQSLTQDFCEFIPNHSRLHDN
jgi:hypothetical protein